MDKSGIDPKNKSSSSDDDFGIIGNTKESECCQCEILTTAQIVQDMAECINDVNDVINLPRITIRNLLNYFKWDKEELLEKYFNGNEEILFSKAKIKNPYNKPKQVMQPDNSEEVECKVCSTLYQTNKMIALDCGHRFCTQCWSEYLKMKIMRDGSAQFIECPAFRCNILIDDVTVLKFITNPTVKVKYQILITNDFVACNKLLRWCPSAGCTYAIKVSFVDDTLPVVCKCSHRFCFTCGESWHDPLKCQVLRNWIWKCGDQKSLNWMAKNTQQCPCCKINIEKIGGCNTMICKNRNCYYEFCWGCRGPRSSKPVAPHVCSGYYEQELRAAGSSRSIDIESEMTRYLYYYNLYMNQMECLNNEKELYVYIKKKVEQYGIIYNAAQQLSSVVDKLCKCRETLMYTYAFAYFLKQNNQSLIFEQNQNDLETAIESLSRYIERDITKEGFTVFSAELQDKYRYCEKRREILSNHVREGYEKGFWDIDVYVNI